MPQPRNFSKRVRALSYGLAFGCALLATSCYGRKHFQAHFGIILDPRVAIAVKPSPTSGGSVPDGGTDSGSPALSGGSGGGGAADSVAPGPGLTVTTEDRFAVQAIAGTPATGLALGSTATSAEFEQIAGITTTPSGTAYVCDPLANQIRAIPPSGPTYVAAGAADGSAGYIGDNLPADAVRLNAPIGLVRDPLSGALIFCDSGNGRIRYFTDGGRIYTLAGGGMDPSDQVSPATFAALQQPFGLAADNQGNLYFTERGSGRVRKLDAAGDITTLGRFATGTVGPLAVSADGRYVWVGQGDAVQLLVPPSTATTPVYQASGTVITGVAFDQANSLYVRQAASVAPGASDTVLVGLLVGADGAMLTGTAPEVLAGNTAGASGTPAFAVPTQPVQDARTQPLAGAGFCALYIDLYGANDPAVLSGTLYMGNSLVSAPGWAQLLTLVRS